MTDYSKVKAELAGIMQCEASELDKYDSFIKAAFDCISSKLCDKEMIDQPSIVHLCATRAYLEIMLSNRDEDVTSFKAGDISFTKNTSSLENARELYALALEACAPFVNGGSFAFKVV